jgi:hypothetical protein
MREGCSERHVRTILPLAFLAPEITRSAIDRRLPERSGIASVLMSLPAPWHEQKDWAALRRASDYDLGVRGSNLFGRAQPIR